MFDVDVRTVAVTWAAAAERLSGYREVAGLTFAELSRAAGISTGYGSKLQRGRGCPRRSTLEDLVDALVAVEPSVGDAGDIIGELVALAGDELAAESADVGQAQRARADRRARAESARTVRARRDLRRAKDLARRGDREASADLLDQAVRELLGGDGVTSP